MNIIIKNINKNKIKIKNNKLYYYYNEYFKIIGIPLKIYYKYITIYNNLYYIYFDENINYNLKILNNHLLKTIPNFLFIRNNITSKFMISNNYKNINNINNINNNIRNCNNSLNSDHILDTLNPDDIDIYKYVTENN